MADFGSFLYMGLEIYTFLIIASVVVSWLIAFNVISMQNPVARNVVGLLDRVTGPAFNLVRRYIPSIGGIDLSPIILLFGCMFLQSMVVRFLIVPSLM